MAEDRNCIVRTNRNVGAHLARRDQHRHPDPQLTPTLDADILNEDAAVAIEELVREHYEEARLRPGAHRAAAETRVPVPHRRAVHEDRSSTSSPATAARPRSSNSSATGSKSSSPAFIPTRSKPYRWHGGEPGPIAREDLPYIREAEARELIERAAELLVAEFGYVRAAERPRQKKTHQRRRDGAAAAPRTGNICSTASAPARRCTTRLRDLAAKLVASGMEAGAAVNFLRALMESSSAPRDDALARALQRNSAPGRQRREKFRQGREPAPQPEPVGRYDRNRRDARRCSTSGWRCRTRRRSTPRSAPSPPTCCQAIRSGSA